MAHQHRDHALENDIAGRMAEGVVDRLEPIDIEYDQRGARIVAADISNRAFQFPLEAAPVVNVEQEIGIGPGLLFVDPGLRLRKLGLERRDLPFRLRQRRGSRLAPCSRRDGFGALCGGLACGFAAGPGKRSRPSLRTPSCHFAARFLHVSALNPLDRHGH